MRTRIFRLLLLPCLSSLPLLHAQAKALSAPTAPLAARYAGESFVAESVESVFDMAADGTGVRERTMVVRIQSEAALRQFGVLAAPFASASEHVEFEYVRVRRPDGTVLETPVTDALEQPEPVTREAPFYSDLKQKQLPVKSLRVGDTLEWRVRVVRTKAEAPNQFWGQESFLDGAVSLHEAIVLRVPKSAYVNVWTNPGLNLKPIETTEGNQRVYRWEHPSLAPTTGKEADDAKEKKKKTLLTADEELDEREGKLPSVAFTTFKSWQQVGEWYRSLAADRAIPDDQVKAKVAEVIAGKTSEEDKVRAVYAFVSTQVRYIGVAFGVGRYQPHLSGQVLENQYGDCKDKHTLLAAMLSVLGLHPEAVLIGASVRFNQAVPSPAAFNHLITRVDVAGQPIWLDSTQEVAPYRMLVYVLRDKPALVIPGLDQKSSQASVERTPKDLPFAPFQKLTAVGSLTPDGTSNSRLTLTTRGDEEFLLRAVLRQIAPAQYDQLVQGLVTGMGFGGTTSHPELGRAEDTANPLVISYDYKREKNGDWDHFKILAQLMPVSLPLVDEATPPIKSIELGVPRTEVSTSELALPKGWGVELPEAVHERSDFAAFDQTYRFDKGTVYAERKLTVLKERLPAGDWKAYKKWTDAAGLSSESYIQLTHTHAGASGDATTATAVGTVSNAEAARLIRQAFTAMETRDFASASASLDQAKALNAEQRDLWGAYGALRYDRGELSASLPFYNKELALHPDSYWAYAPIVRAQLFTKHRPEALRTLRAWSAANPSDPAPTLQLMALLIEDNDPRAAVEEAEAGIARLPEDRRKDEHLQLALGGAEIKAGMQEKGAATLAALLKTTEDPLVMNNGAYALGDAGLELALAEATQRKALHKLSEESQSWTLDEAPATLRQKSALLIASWDTLGWILFREGRLEDAESFIHSAWLGKQNAEIGEHLGDIEAARGQSGEAFRSYTLALASISAYDGLGVKVAPGAQARRIEGKLRGVKKEGEDKKFGDPHRVLQSIRTHPLGPADGRQGTAEYLLLIANGKVERLHPADTKSLAGAEALIKRADLLLTTPAGSDAKLAVGAIMNCHAATCELIVEP